MTRAPGYLLRVQPGEMDLERFRGLVDRARTSEPAEAAELLARALAIWRGHALADLVHEPVAGVAAGLDELRLEALDLRIDADLELGRLAAIISELGARPRAAVSRAPPSATRPCAVPVGPAGGRDGGVRGRTRGDRLTATGIRLAPAYLRCRPPELELPSAQGLRRRRVSRAVAFPRSVRGAKRPSLPSSPLRTRRLLYL